MFFPELTEEKLDEICRGFGRARQENSKMAAIRAVRDYTYMGLKEAGDFVERFWNEKGSGG